MTNAIHVPRKRAPSCADDYFLHHSTYIPAPPHVLRIQNKLESAFPEQLRLLSAQISQTEALLIALTEQREALLLEYGAYQASLSTMRRLPTEILSGIFQLVVDDTCNGRNRFGEKQIVLMEVCKRWKWIVEASPLLWSRINISTVRSSGSATRYNSKALDRLFAYTRDLPIESITVDDPFDILPDSIWQTIFSSAHITRWKSAEVVMDSKKAGYLMNQGPSATQFPFLKHLSLKFVRFGLDIATPASDAPLDLFTSAPSLTSVSVTDHAGCTLAHPLALPYSQLTRLSCAGRFVPPFGTDLSCVKDFEWALDAPSSSLPLLLPPTTPTAVFPAPAAAPGVATPTQGLVGQALDIARPTPSVLNTYRLGKGLERLVIGKYDWEDILGLLTRSSETGNDDDTLDNPMSSLPSPVSTHTHTSTMTLRTLILSHAWITHPTNLSTLFALLDSVPDIQELGLTLDYRSQFDDEGIWGYLGAEGLAATTKLTKLRKLRIEFDGNTIRVPQGCFGGPFIQMVKGRVGAMGRDKDDEDKGVVTALEKLNIRNVPTSGWSEENPEVAVVIRELRELAKVWGLEVGVEVRQ
ncbi:hypothetical protein VKT23_012404 [Stygiomarasmius scandens]|uniref:F-box domain-containing protein n=1 Tax=Marasmiellus scandens TaxID=2682957 RepID=A0ABR1JAX8_9AGAR